MAVELEIRLEGNAPGLAEHRLSLSAFGPSLENLLEALRRIASGVVRDATMPDYGVRGGRYTKQARRLDVQVQAVDEGSLKLVLVLALQAVAGQGNLFQDLPERAGKAFVQAVEDEGHGRMRNAMVRRYLESLPAEITAQSYSVNRDGVAIETARLGQVSLSNDAGPLPALIRVDGRITGVGFPPGKPEVRVRFARYSAHFSATPGQVDEALALREKVAEIAAVVIGKNGRLLAVREAGTELRQLSNEQRVEALFARWDGLLRRLAR